MWQRKSRWRRWGHFGATLDAAEWSIIAHLTSKRQVPAIGSVNGEEAKTTDETGLGGRMGMMEERERGRERQREKERGVSDGSAN